MSNLLKNKKLKKKKRQLPFGLKYGIVFGFKNYPINIDSQGYASGWGDDYKNSCGKGYASYFGDGYGNGDGIMKGSYWMPYCMSNRNETKFYFELKNGEYLNSRLQAIAIYSYGFASGIGNKYVWGDQYGYGYGFAHGEGYGNGDGNGKNIIY